MPDRPRRFFVMIGGVAYATLLELAQKERRQPQDQAAVLLEEMLELIDNEGPARSR